MPQDPHTPTEERSHSFAPPELVADLESVLDNATAIEARRMKPGKQRHVTRINLTCDGVAVVHGKRTDRDADDLAAELYALCEGDADEHCNGHASYKMWVTFAKPPSGKTAAPRTIELRIGQVFESLEAAQKYTFVEQLLAERKQMWDQHLALITRTTSLADSVAKMANGLAAAFAGIHAQQREVTAESEVRALARTELESDRERLAAFTTMMSQFAPLLAAKLGLPMPTANAVTVAEPVKVARELVASLRGDQRALIQQHAPALLGELADEKALLGAVAHVSGLDMAVLIPILETFDAQQQERFEKLLAWAKDKG